MIEIKNLVFAIFLYSFIFIELIKAQNLSNLIILGEERYRFININSNQDNNLVVLVTKAPGSGDRLFYGLKSNGRFLFKDENNEEYPYKHYLISGQETRDQLKHDGESLFIKLYNENNNNVNGNEYYICMGKADQYIELFNFNENSCNNFMQSKLLFDKEIFSHRGTFIRLTKQGSSSLYYYLLAAITKTGEKENEVFYFQLRTFNFPSVNIEDRNSDKNIIFSSIKSKIISCFETDFGNIICFYRANVNYIDSYVITTFQYGLNEQNTHTFTLAQSDSAETFYKGIHLKNEIGVFIYFCDGYIPYIAFKEFPSYTSMNDYNSFGAKLLNFDNSFNSGFLLNDILKISDTKICYASPNTERTELYVAIITLFNNDNNINITYYKQLIYENNNYMIFKDIKLDLYNNQFITLGLSLCNTTTCEKDENPHFASFLIFSYPNSSDVSINLINILKTTTEEVSFNLEEYCKIENNIFGFVLKEIKILSIPPKIKLISANSSLEINATNTLSKNEYFTIDFVSDDIIEVNNYIIEFALVITEENEGNFGEQKVLYSTNTNENENEDTILENGSYLGKTSYFTIGINEELTTQNCNTDYHYECSVCLSNDIEYCISCRTTPYFEDDKKKCRELVKIPTTLPTNIPTTIPTTLPTSLPTSIPSTIMSTILTTSFISNKPEQSPILLNSTIPIIIPIQTSILQDNFECTNEKILENKCNEGKMTAKQIENIHDNLIDNLKEFNKTNTIISTQNVVFQVSTLEQQKNNIFYNISSIDLGECEEKIRKNIIGDDNLIIIKTDIKDMETLSTFVQYEVYDPIDLQKIDLSICENEISISVPVYLNEDIEDFNEKLNNYGYNIFNENDSFYNDICTKYTSEDGKDVTLNDRRNEIYGLVSNINLCQKGCNLEYYNSTTKQAKCNCATQNEDSSFITDIDEIKNNFFNKDSLVSLFSKGLMSSNFMVLKCYKLAINFKDHINNYGCIIISILLFFFILFLLIYVIRGNKSISKFIQIILYETFPSSENKEGRIQTINIQNFKNKKIKEKIKEEIKNKKENKNKKEDIKEKNKKDEKKKDDKKKDKKKRIEKKRKSNEIKNKYINTITFKNKNKPKNKVRNKTNFPPKKNIYSDSRKNKPSPKKNTNESISKLNVKSFTINNTTADKYKKTKNKLKNDSLRFSAFSSSKINIKARKREINKNKFKNLNDLELNSLEYKYAIIYDKRTYFQYYCSLIKKKHLICFAFIPSNDYNVMALKISFFLISFSLYFTVNGLFFTDDTMHSIYVSEGTFNIFNQISIIIYSSLISLVIQQILRLLCLSENDIINIKREKDFGAAFKKSKTVKECLTIKFIIFYILGFLLMLFFWYFITCFCAVYHNTQLILIKDTFVSFAISMLYPFEINLLPGIFRISSLRAVKKDKNCIYKFGLIVALF